MNKATVKRNEKRIVILIVMLFISVLIYPIDKGYACSCSQPDPPKEALKGSSAVFSGKVIDTVDRNKNNVIQSSADPITILFDVDKSWKGVDQTQVIVYTERSSASCGYGFSLNEKYLVYAYEENGELRVNACSRTAPLSGAKEDIQALGKGQKPTEQVTLDLENIKGQEKTPSVNVTNNKQIYIALILLVLLVAVVIMRRHRKK
ncbi:hypothetical protein [Viridibacillus arvi]|uniref:Tissue inhibitor of metalloproteinase n=1 Tax=Viridibacillus arvi TaxID=263475 RepID=A0A0M0LLU5_9BACL|nr:hypothetical protein [Viridibacillus arvi]KOO52009.1 hypothetical protein AMD00_06210 [Viridibacillus arvi]